MQISKFAWPWRLTVLAFSTVFACIAYAQEDNSDRADNLLEEIVVTATRTERSLMEVPAAVTVQNFDDLRAQGFTYGTDEFRGVPGVFFRRGEGDGDEFPFISIRGVTGNHGNDTFLALVDGIPFVGADEEVLMYELPYAIFDSVEVVRGPVSALYGRGGIAGAVNYRTRNPTGNVNNVAVSGGEDGYFRGEFIAERVADQKSFLFSLSHEDYDGWRENSQREISNVFVKGRMEFGDASVLSGYLNYSDRHSDVSSAIPTLADGTIVEVAGGREGFNGYLPTYNDLNGYIAAVTYEHAFSDTLELRLTGQYRSFDSDIRLNFYDYFEFDPANNIMGVNGFASEGDSDVLYSEAVLFWTTGNHTIVSGLSAERTNLDEFDLWSGENDPFFDGSCGFKFFAILIDYSTSEVVNRDSPCFVVDQLQSANSITNTFLGAFIQDEIALTDEWTLTLGARYDLFERDGNFTVVGGQPGNVPVEGDEGAWSPKLSLAKTYGSGMVYGSYGRGFNSNFGPAWQWDPSSYERVEKPTTIDSIEFGWKGRTLDGLLTWETAVFYLEQKNRRTFVPNPDFSGPPTLATTGQLYSSQGLEASVRIAPTDNTQLMLNYTYLDPNWDEFIVESFGGPLDFSGTTPQGVPNHIAFIELTHQFTERLSAGTSYEWNDDYYITVDNAYRDGSFGVLNLFGSAKLFADREWYLDVAMMNALDNDYYYYFGGSRTAVALATPGVPRQLRATLRFSF